MKTIIFEELNFLNFFLIIFYRLKGFKVYFINISKNLQNLKLLNFLKKKYIFWFNFEEYNLDDVETFQMYYYLEISSKISNIFSSKLGNTFIKNNFLNKDNFKICIEYNLKQKIFTGIKIYKIFNFLKNRNKCLLWANNNIVNNFIFEKFNIKNQNKFSLTFLEVFIYITKILARLLNLFNFLEKKIVQKKNNYKKIFTKIVYFPHGIFTNGLYKKDFFYSQREYSPLTPSNILHIEWNNSYLDRDSKKFYKKNNINYLLWQNIFLTESIKSFFKIFLNNIKIFFNVFLWDYEMFKTLCFSIIKVNKALFFFNNFSQIKYLFSGHSDLFPPELLVAAKKKNIVTVSIEDRIVLSAWSSRLLFDHYFVAGKKSLKYLKKKQYPLTRINLIKSFIFKSQKIKKNKTKNSFLNCLVLDYHSDEDWYINGTNTVNNTRRNKEFYNLILELSYKFNDINFLIKSKNFKWLKNKYFLNIINQMRIKKNIKILQDQKKWTPEYSASYCDFALGLHTSLLDEIFAANKPIIIYDRDKYPSMIYNIEKNLIARNKGEIIEKIIKLKNNFSYYNKKLDKQRALHFYKFNSKKLKSKLMKIVNQNT